MPRLFSYGTLQDRSVQRATFGRELEGRADALTGYARGQVPVREPDVLAMGMTHYDNAVRSDGVGVSVTGTVYEVTEAELALADTYEAPAAYLRVAVTLASGTPAWVYVHEPGRS